MVPIVLEAGLRRIINFLNVGYEVCLKCSVCASREERRGEKEVDTDTSLV